MKNFILTICITALVMIANAQTDFTKAMLKGKAMLDSANTYEAALSASNYFERIAANYKNEWLAPYYAGLANLSAGIQSKDEKKKDDCYLRGLEFVNQAKELRQKESEILTLEGYLKLMYIANSPMMRAPTQTGAAFDLLDEAKQLNPANPRPYYVHGQHLMYTPKFFGGGAKNAEPLLQKAGSLYKTYTPSNELMPAWGMKRCEKLLGECKSQLAEK